MNLFILQALQPFAIIYKSKPVRTVNYLQFIDRIHNAIK